MPLTATTWTPCRRFTLIVFMSPEMTKPVMGAHHVKTIYVPLFDMAPNVKDEVFITSITEMK
ncbi:MAG TPA: hypothetical protein VIG72_04490 [Pontibacter sp.]